MKELDAIIQHPEVVGAVLGDSDGALIDWTDSIDGESAAAVNAYAAQSLTRAGDLVGLGDLQSMTIGGGKSPCIIVNQAGGLLGVYVDSRKPLSAIEKKLLSLLQD